MKPLKLKIDGLQSFKNSQTIDFELLGSMQLFGIFGDTGSGKSTILDAMILCLYGEIPRNENSPGKTKNLNQNINFDSDEINVEFEFEIENIVYIISRRYSRKRNNKNIVEPRSNKMFKINIDEPVLIADSISGVESELNKIFRIKKSDFYQSVILPQGKFNDFIRLKGTERAETLARIFNLTKYGKPLADIIKSDLNEINLKYREIEDKISTSKTKEDVDELHNELKNNENMTVKLKKVLLDFERKYSELSRNKILYNEKLAYTKIVEKFQKNQNIRDDETKRLIKYQNYTYFDSEIKSLNQNNKFIEELKFKIDKLKIKIEDNKYRKKLIQENFNQLTDSKNILIEEYNNIHFDPIELDSLQKDKNDLTNYQYIDDRLRNSELKFSECVKLVDNNRFKFSVEENKLFECEKFFKDHTHPSAEKIQYFKIELDRKIHDGKKIKIDLETVTNLNEELDFLNQKLFNETTKCDILSEEIIKLTNLRDNNFAASLALKLSEGEKCLVCGSLSHPDVANYLDGYSEELLNLSKINKEKSQKKITELKVNIDVTNSKLSELKKVNSLDLYNNTLDESSRLSKKIQKFQVQYDKELVEFQNYQKIKNITDANLKSLKLEYQSLILNIENIKEQIQGDRKVLKSLSKPNFTNEELDLKIQNSIKIREIKNELSSKIEQIKSKVSLKNDELYRINTEIKIAVNDLDYNENKLNELLLINEDIESTIENLCFKFEYKNIEDVKSYKVSSMVIENLIKKLFAEETEYEDAKNQLRTLVDIVDIDEDEVSTLVNDIETTKVLIDDNLKTYGIMKNEYMETFESFQASKSLVQQIKKIKLELDETEMIYATVKNSKFMNHLSNLRLTTILKNASSKITDITNGQYELISVENEFYVIDHFDNANIRSASTLSGGETFIISLCLALALSQQLQIQGATKLDFFFLDEGFGTLDEVTLFKVLDSLDKIKNEDNIVIGLISHVESLKYLLPIRLDVVKNDKLGSQVKIKTEG